MWDSNHPKPPAAPAAAHGTQTVEHPPNVYHASPQSIDCRLVAECATV